MVIISSITLTLYLISTISYCLNGMPTYHLQLSRSSLLGEVFGVIIDPMSVAVGVVVITAGYLFLVYSIEYMSPHNKMHPVYQGKGRFYAWMLLFVGSTLAFIHSSTVLQLLMFFELMSLACWGLISYYGTTKAIRSAFKALITTHVGSMIGLYTACGIAYTHLHDLGLTSLAQLEPDPKLLLIVAVMIAGLAKSAQFPFYSWLPDAMIAPTPASAFLHGAAMVEMGVYLLARIIQYSQPIPHQFPYILSAMLVATLLICMLMYPIQKDAKRLLAYSTIAESSIMYLGLIAASLGFSEGIRATILQLFNHAYVKGLAFLVAGVFAYSLGTLDINKITYLLRKMPLIAAGWTLSLLGLAGIPPFGVFFGKINIAFSLALSSTVSPYFMILLLVLLVDSAVFFAVALSRIQKMVFVGNHGDGSNVRIRLPRLMIVSIVLLIILSIIANYIAIPFVNSIRLVGVGY